MNTNSYKDLVVWQKSIELVTVIYILTSKFPKEEVYGLAIQMRRAAVSIPSNIAEGSKRKDLPEYLHFLRIATGSCAELETQLIIAQKLYPRVDYVASNNLIGEIQKMMSSLISSLRSKSTT